MLMRNGVLVSLLRLARAEPADELRGYSRNLPAALHGWRAVQLLYDLSGLPSAAAPARNASRCPRGGNKRRAVPQKPLVSRDHSRIGERVRHRRTPVHRAPTRLGVGRRRRLSLRVVPLRDCRGRRLADSGRASPPTVSGTQSGVQSNHSWAREGGRCDRSLLRREQSQPVHRALDGPASDRQENPEDTRRVRSADRLGRPDDLARDSVHERHRGELLLFPAERGRPCDRSMALRPREPDWRNRSGLPVSLAAPSLSPWATHLGAMPRFDVRANVSKKPHVRSLAVMMPSTLSRRVTTIHRVFLSSITRAAARNVVSGLTVATGDVMMSRTRTFDGFFPFEVTCHTMSRSVIRPIGRPCWTTTSPPIFFAAI